jgi:hypothetical protein
MKSGVGDPFDDEPEDEPEVEEAATEEMESEPESEQSSPSSRDQYPLTLRRDNVKDERPNVHQLFVQDSTDAAAKDAERELEDRLGEDVYRLDAREAIYLAGMQNLDDAEDVLREWGYDL